MTARTLMIQGTASSVGKSIVVTALCRLFRQAGLRVAPFKSQNMALNAHVTADGGEIGRAQAVQAEACGVEPTVDMNPILLKPEANSRSQVVVLGRSIGTFSARDYHERKPDLRQTVRDALERLRGAYDLVVIEGAGSPAEINLKSRELVNMFVAEAADAPVLLVGDIDRGGVFASIVGTLELLEPHERERVAGFVINKFRGDPRLLDSGLEFLERRTGKPVLGVLPFVEALRIADEDSTSLAARRHRRRVAPSDLEIAVLRLPRISNHDDFLPLEHEPGVVVRFVDEPEELDGADLVIVPGTKSTIADLEWLRRVGLADALHRRALAAEPILGICGGCQMLGRAIVDESGVETGTSTRVEGLGLLGFTTRFEPQKHTAQVRARLRRPSFLGGDVEAELRGYEIHGGRLQLDPTRAAAFTLLERRREPCAIEDGEVSASGLVVGTMIHGLFENTALRASMLERLRARRQPSARAQGGSDVSPEEGRRLEGAKAAPPGHRTDGRAGIDEYDRLASIVGAHLDIARLRAIVGLEGKTP